VLWIKNLSLHLEPSGGSSFKTCNATIVEIVCFYPRGMRRRGLTGYLDLLSGLYSTRVRSDAVQLATHHHQQAVLNETRQTYLGRCSFDLEGDGLIVGVVYFQRTLATL
jgi:hypothetical protein